MGNDIDLGFPGDECPHVDFPRMICPGSTLNA